MNKYKFITIETDAKSFHIKITQKYIPEYNMGHYNYVITDKKGNIIHTSFSSGAAYEGKINMELLNREMEYFLKQYKQLHPIL